MSNSSNSTSDTHYMSGYRCHLDLNTYSSSQSNGGIDVYASGDAELTIDPLNNSISLNLTVDSVFHYSVYPVTDAIQPPLAQRSQSLAQEYEQFIEILNESADTAMSSSNSRLGTISMDMSDMTLTVNVTNPDLSLNVSADVFCSGGFMTIEPDSSEIRLAVKTHLVQTLMANYNYNYNYQAPALDKKHDSAAKTDYGSASLFSRETRKKEADANEFDGIAQLFKTVP